MRISYNLTWHCSVSKESLVDVNAVVAAAPKPIDSCTQKLVELYVKELWVVSASQPKLPLQIEDASRSVNDTEVK
jgi:aspartyl-tRNA synthetase